MSTFFKTQLTSTDAPQPVTVRPRKRAEAKAHSREALIEAAIALIPSHGLDVSLDEVCAHAGYTRGAFYQHFEDRDALIAVVTGRVAQQLLDMAVGRLTGASATDLTSIGQTVLDLLKRDAYPIGRGGLMRSHQLLQACDRSAAVKQQYLDVFDRAREAFTTLVTNAQTQGVVNPKLDPAALATVGIAMVVGFRTLHDVGAPMDLDALTALFDSLSAA